MGYTMGYTGDVLKLKYSFKDGTDTLIHDVIYEAVHEFEQKKDQYILDHFETDLSELREYLDAKRAGKKLVPLNLAGVFHAINMVAYEAIIYGGDAGGPYCTEPEGLQGALQNAIDLFDADEEYEVKDKPLSGCGTIPMIVRREVP